MNNFLLQRSAVVMGNTTINSSMNYYIIYRSISIDIYQALIAVVRFCIYKNQAFL